MNYFLLNYRNSKTCELALQQAGKDSHIMLYFGLYLRMQFY